MGDIYSHPARVLMGSGDARLVELARQHAYDPAIFDEHPPFIFPVEASSDRLDSYYTRMADSSLRNYAADATAGVSFQDSHNPFALGFGKVFLGEYEHTGDVARVVAYVYSLPGLNLNGISTDDLIAGVRAGIVKDVSVGFYGPRFVCGLCGRDPLWDMDCPHIPGLTYTVKDGDANTTRVAFAWIEDAHLAEVSAVYKGATPGAAVLKAQMEAEAGRLSPTQRSLIEDRYRVHLPDRRVAVPGMTLPPPAPPSEETPMDFEQFRAALTTELGAPADADPLAYVRNQHTRLTALTTERDGLAAQVAELTPLAEQGRAYRADLIEETLRLGVQAQGNAFPVDAFRALLDKADLAYLQQMRAFYAAQADAALPTGRRSTEEVDPRPADPAPTPEPTIPAAFHRP